MFNIYLIIIFVLLSIAFVLWLAFAIAYGYYMIKLLYGGNEDGKKY